MITILAKQQPQYWDDTQHGKPYYVAIFEYLNALYRFELVKTRDGAATRVIYSLPDESVVFTGGTSNMSIVGRAIVGLLQRENLMP